MKKFIISVLAIAASFAITASAAKLPDYNFKQASELTLLGKLMPTSNPYHRVDTSAYKGFTKGENLQVRCPAGLSVAFKTNSPSIGIRTIRGQFKKQTSTTMLSTHGFDLYIKKDGKWLWAAAGAIKGNEKPWQLIRGLGTGEKECLLYLPLYCEMESVEIGAEDGCTLEALKNPFKHRIAIFGSSFTHGVSTSRAGMAYPAQFTRHTGIQMLSLGCSGNCKLQSYFADVLVDAKDIDAFVFDSFSNPNPKQMRARLFTFIEKIQAAHPGKPLIFQQTIYREWRNFNSIVDKREQAKMDTAEELMKEAMAKYKDVYFIYPNATDEYHETSVDGTHPGDYGYTLWSRSIEKPILDILEKYGIK